MWPIKKKIKKKTLLIKLKATVKKIYESISNTDIKKTDIKAKSVKRR
jgi:hypothetical protein